LPQIRATFKAAGSRLCADHPQPHRGTTTVEHRRKHIRHREKHSMKKTNKEKKTGAVLSLRHISELIAYGEITVGEKFPMGCPMKGQNCVRQLHLDGSLALRLKVSDNGIQGLTWQGCGQPCADFERPIQIELRRGIIPVGNIRPESPGKLLRCTRSNTETARLVRSCYGSLG
jgi:hypothetical protein